MTEKPPKSSVSVDLGARAEAKFEVKAEVPTSSVGRVVDAFTDIIRPFSEARGLRGDQIRLQREDVLLEVARRARVRLEIEAGERRPLSLKFLVPLIEKASTEDIDSELISWWASLLASAVAGGGRHPIFVEMMGRITSDEAQFLENLWKSLDPQEVKHTYSEIFEAVSKSFDDEIGRIPDYFQLNQKPFDDCIRQIATNVGNKLQKEGMFCRHMRFPTHNQKENSLTIDTTDQRLFDICVTAGILKRIVLSVPVPTPFIGEFSVSGEFFVFSDLGLEFMKASHF